MGSHVVVANVSWMAVLDSRGMSGAVTGGGRGTGRAAAGGRNGRA